MNMKPADSGLRLNQNTLKNFSAMTTMPITSELSITSRGSGSFPGFWDSSDMISSRV